jgi:hypothetical protein
VAPTETDKEDVEMPDAGDDDSDLDGRGISDEEEDRDSLVEFDRVTQLN